MRERNTRGLWWATLLLWLNPLPFQSIGDRNSYLSSPSHFHSLTVSQSSELLRGSSSLLEHHQVESRSRSRYKFSPAPLDKSHCERDMPPTNKVCHRPKIKNQIKHQKPKVRSKTLMNLSLHKFRAKNTPTVLQKQLYKNRGENQKWKIKWGWKIKNQKSNE